MATTALSGLGTVIWYPYGLDFSSGFQTPTALTATGEKYAMSGRVWYPDQIGNATRAIRRVGFRFGAITKAGGSALTVSLQDVSLTAGAPMQPDETQDQTVAVANADIAANTWLRTGALSADRTVSYGDLVSIVIEYDGAGRLGADSITITQYSRSTAGGEGLQATPARKSGGTWTSTNHIPVCVLEFSDGSFGNLLGGLAVSALNTHTFKQDTAVSDEFALAFQLPVPATVDGALIPTVVAANTSDFSVVLYDGTSAMTGGTVAIDANAVTVNNAARLLFVPFAAEIALSANHQYYLAVQPTQTTGTVSVFSFDVNAAGQLVCHPGGTNFNYSTRLDLGSWAAATTTRRLLAGLSISRLDDGAGSGGGASSIGLGSPVIRAG